MRENFLLGSDSYKHSHAVQIPNITSSFSYIEARTKYNSCVFFGLQGILQECLVGDVLDMSMILEAEDLLAEHFQSHNVFPKAQWLSLLHKHGGRMPLRIKAVPEGTVIPNGNVLITIENTDPEFPWLTSFIETFLLRIWYPVTVATISHEIKSVISYYLRQTGDPSLIDFKLHDFGARGVSSQESSGIGGCAHLLSFKGTDNLPGLAYAKRHYDGMGYSLAAAEHSTITSWGRGGEIAAYRNCLAQFEDVSIVTDSYNQHDAIVNIWGKVLKQEVLNRKGKTIIRLDSGNPETAVLDAVQRLGESYGLTINSKGYKVLNPKIGVLQGDGINEQSIKTILHKLQAWNWSADNVNFGMGGALLQRVDRDTQGFAQKCSSVTVNGKQRDSFKEPAGDPFKKSKAGRLKLVMTKDGYKTVREEDSGENVLEEVFLNGELRRKDSMAVCQERVKATIFIPPTKELAWSDKGR